jgi:hypothetical protein
LAGSAAGGFGAGSWNLPSAQGTKMPHPNPLLWTNPAEAIISADPHHHISLAEFNASADPNHLHHISPEGIARLGPSDVSSHLSHQDKTSFLIVRIHAYWIMVCHNIKEKYLDPISLWIMP